MYSTYAIDRAAGQGGERVGGLIGAAYTVRLRID